jgi:hypothetical protein
MSDLWLRQAAVTFGPKGGTGVIIRSGLFRSDVVAGPRIPDVSIGNARISFDIIKNNESTANNAKIRIYNLSENSRNFLNGNDSVGDIQATLEVGYKQQGLKVLFIGDVDRSSYKRVGPDWITEMECGDGLQVNEVTFDKSYAGGDVKVDIQTIVKDIVDQIKDKAKVNVDNLLAQIKEKVKSEKIDWGLNVEGLAMKTLNQLLGKQGKEVSTQNNNLEMAEPTEKASTKDKAIIISPATGMIGSPIQKEKGVEFKALINPILSPMGQVNSIFLDSKGFNSIYRIRSLKFKGDTHDNPWFMQGVAI